MSTPDIHTFGKAEYVYASAYDQIEAERDAANKAWNDLTVVNESNLAKYAALKAERDRLKSELDKSRLNIKSDVQRYRQAEAELADAQEVTDNYRLANDQLEAERDAAKEAWNDLLLQYRRRRYSSQ